MFVKSQAPYLSIMKGRWFDYGKVMVFSLFIFYLDFLLTSSMPYLFEQVDAFIKNPNFELTSYILFLGVLIILRPLIGFLISSVQIYLLQKILRKIETEVAKIIKVEFDTDVKNYSASQSANIIITHGRYFIDNFLIPLSRAITEAGPLVFVGIGMFVVFPIPVVLFFVSILALLLSYYFFSRNIIQHHGELLVRSSEKIMELSSKGLYQNIEYNEKGNKGTKRSLIDLPTILDEKMLANTILGSLSQGAKYIVEFCALISFGIASFYLLLTDPSQIGPFVSTFVYAGLRLLPSISSVIGFFQSKENASHAMEQLAEKLSKR